MGLELSAELKRGGRFDYMHRAELHGRPGAGVEGVVIEVNPAETPITSIATVSIRGTAVETVPAILTPMQSS